MAIIYSYPLNTNILPTDVILGTTTSTINQRNQTKSFKIEDLADYFLPSLDQVLDRGNTSLLDAKIGQLYVFDEPNGEYSKIAISDSSFTISRPNATFTPMLSTEDGSNLILTNSNGGAAQILNNLSVPRTYTLPNASGTFALTSTVFQYEIHVSQVDGSDTTGTGSLLNPVATITKALTLVIGERRTIIIHPGSYTESPSITVQYTVLVASGSSGVIGGNVSILGTVTTNIGCTISGLKISALIINGVSGTGNINILNCDITGTLTKNGTADYTLVRFCDIGALNVVSTAGVLAVFGGNPSFITINSIGASILVKNAVCVSPVVLVGNATFADCIIISTTLTSNAITTSPGTQIVIANSQILIPSIVNVARVSLSGFYSIINTVYDKINSTLVPLSGTGGNTNSIVYSQFINADKFIKQGGLSTEFLKADGSTSTMPTLQEVTTAGSTTSVSAIAVTNGKILIGTAQTGQPTFGSDPHLVVTRPYTGTSIGGVIDLRNLSPSIVVNDLLGKIQFTGKDDVTVGYTSGAIECIAAGSAGTGSGGGGILKFMTAATSTGASPIEKMRITESGIVQPGTDNSYSLGASGIRWSAVWAANGTIQTSDEREKKDIVDSDLGLDFISKLRPVSFKWKVGKNEVTSEPDGLDEEGNQKTKIVVTPIEGKRTHYGLIAQEVETLLDGKDFGGFINDDKTGIKGLRYDQFIPALINAIKELKAEIEILKVK